MARGVRDTIEWFARNLDWWLEDQFLTKEGIEVDLCFDSVDVSKTIEGMRYYYTGPEGNGHSFELDNVFQVSTIKPLQDNVLVHCLAFSGQLGTIKMLPPHQAELSSVLNHLENSEIRCTPTELTRHFLSDAADRLHLDYENRILTDLDEIELTEFVRRYAGSSVSLFKIIQLIRGSVWQRRLGELYNKGVLRLERPQEKYDEVVSSDHFWTLKASFDKRRPRLSRNNFADAFAICTLLRRVEQFKISQSDRLPRFFASSPLFLHVINEVGVGDLLRYELGNGLRSNALRPADYFVFKCTFTDSDDICALRQQIEQLLKNPVLLGEEKVLTSGRPLAEIIADLNRLSFFENVWRPTAEEHEAPQVMRDLDEASQLVEKFDDPLFKDEVTQSYRTARKELEEKSIEYRQINELWHEIEHTAADLREQVQKRSHGLNLFREFGLSRFGFDRQARQKMETVLDDLLAPQEEQARHARLTVINAYHNAHKDPIRYLSELNAASAVLWVTERYKQLVELLENVTPLPHYSLTVIYAAAAFNSDLKHHTGLATKGVNALERLIQDSNLETDLETGANLSVGIAYLMFRRWLWLGGTAAWREKSKRPNIPSHLELQTVVNGAIEFANQAFELFEKLSVAPGADQQTIEEKTIYALNQYLFYLVEGGTKDQEQKMHDAATRLLSFNQEPVWQYRFDDTLARYYHRFAVVGSSKKRKKRLEQAQKFIEKSCKAAPWDRDIQAYHDSLIHGALASGAEEKP